jgi:hypothetical protein
MNATRIGGAASVRNLLRLVVEHSNESDRNGGTWQRKGNGCRQITSSAIQMRLHCTKQIREFQENFSSESLHSNFPFNGRIEMYNYALMRSRCVNVEREEERPWSTTSCFNLTEF